MQAAQFNKFLVSIRAGRYENAEDFLKRANGSLPDSELLQLKSELVRERLLQLARRGIFSWGGGKPKGSRPRVMLDLDKPLSEYVIENRR